MSDRSYHSHTEPWTGAISRWVAGSTFSYRFVFLSYLSDVSLEPGGRPAVHEIYVLTRFSSHVDNVFKDLSIKRKATRKLASIQCSPRKEKLHIIEEVELGLLLENVEVAAAIDRLFDIIPSRHSRGLGSLFDKAFLCTSAFVKPAATVANPGSVEVEVTIYSSDEADFRLHSVFRVESPNL